MILNRIKLGTDCIVRNSGAEGKVNKIFFYPTKFEIKFDDGHIEHYSSKDLEFKDLKQTEATLRLPEVPLKGIGEAWFHWAPFKSKSLIEHHFSTTMDIAWKMITSLEMYNVWFHGIQRTLPIIEKERYVHNYSFAQLDLKPGAYFKIRPMTIAPWFRCRVMTFEKNKKFGFTFKATPFNKEYILFSIRETKYGVWITCERSSQGLFSILNQFNWSENKKILQNLDTIIPKINDSNSSSEKIGEVSSVENQPSSISREDIIALLVNKGLDGDMEAVNANNDKIIRGKVKAMIVKINRGTTERPPVPKIETMVNSVSVNQPSSISREDIIALLVNKGLDGDMEAVNANNDKIIRGKVKAMIVKINRGTAERPPIPELDDGNDSNYLDNETSEERFEKLVANGLDGNMDEINALTDKVLRGKIKAAIIKAKRLKKS